MATEIDHFHISNTAIEIATRANYRLQNCRHLQATVDPYDVQRRIDTLMDHKITGFETKVQVSSIMGYPMPKPHRTFEFTVFDFREVKESIIRDVTRDNRHPHLLLPETTSNPLNQVPVDKNSLPRRLRNAALGLPLLNRVLS